MTLWLGLICFLQQYRILKCLLFICIDSVKWCRLLTALNAFWNYAGVLFYCIAPTRRHQRCAELVITHKADVNNCTVQGTPILVKACETAHENEQLCLMMLDAGADPNSKDLVSFENIFYFGLLNSIRCLPRSWNNNGVGSRLWLTCSFFLNAAVVQVISLADKVTYHFKIIIGLEFVAGLHSLCQSASQIAASLTVCQTKKD